MPKNSTVFKYTLRGFLFAAIGIAIFRISHSPIPSCEAFHTSVKSWGTIAPAIYIVISVLASLLFLPRTPVVIFAGLCFGVAAAVILDLTASLLGATTGFLIARHFARGTFLRLARPGKLFRHSPWLGRLVFQTEKRGLSFVLLIRLIHLFPFGAMNYTFGVLPVRFRSYVIGTFLGLLPGTFVLAYVGNTFGCALLEGRANIPLELRYKIALGFLLLILLSAIPLFLNRERPRPGG
jgi:uncharacterized membrane protein YdjX (TVP38/TMEM64 family)